MSLTVIGISHHHAGFSVREEFYLSEERCRTLLKKWAQQYPQHSFVILSTCNRLELYTDIGLQHPDLQSCINELSDYKKIFFDYCYKYSERACVQHLFKVACALDSKIIGENQIIGQIKQAFKRSCEEKCIKHLMQRLFEQSFYWARRLKKELLDSSMQTRSWGEAAARWLNHVLPKQESRNILLVGAGKTIEQCLEFYDKRPGDKLFLCNRRAHKLQRLRYAQESSLYDLQSLPHLFETQHFDVVIAATSSPDLIIHKRYLENNTQNMLLLDLSMPRNIDAGIEDLPHKKLVVLDHLPLEVKQLNPGSLSALENAIDRFVYWKENDTQRVLIKMQRQKVLQTQQELLDKALRKLQHGQKADDVLKLFSHQLTQKLLHQNSVVLHEDMLE